MKLSKIQLGLTKACLTAGSLALISASSLAIAQENDSNDNEAMVEEIVITGVRGSILNNLNQKRDAGSFVDAISAEEMGKFPDLNLSESLQRVPGVTLTRNDFGDGSSINLRGLGPTYSRVEINGLTGPVNDARGGGFNFEILASELFSNARVKKSFNASDAEGGLAGLVELSTPHALEREGFNMTLSAKGQYAENADDIGPRTAILISQNWDDTFGITASLAYSDTQYITASNGGISARPLSAPATSDLRDSATQAQLDGLVPQTLNYEINNDARKTLGATLGFQYRPSDRFELTVDSIFGNIDGERRFTRADAPPESQLKTISNETIENGAIISATLTDVQNRVASNDTDIEEDFFLLSASATFRPNDDWEVTPFVGTTSRELSNDATLLSFARGDLNTGELLRFPVSYDVNGQFIEFSSPGLDLADPAIANEYMLNVFLIRPTFDKDEEVSAKLDVTRYFDEGAMTRIDFGARYADRELERQFIEVRIDNASGDTDLRTLPTLADALVMEDFAINGAPSSFPSQVVSANPDAILDLYFLNGFDIDAYRSPVAGSLENQYINGLTVPGSVLINRQARAAQNTFSGEENTLAAYVEASFEFDNAYVNVGVRYVSTEQTSYGYQVANNLSTPISSTSDYSELLPSVNLRYELTDEVQLRASYSKSLTRPTLYNLRVSESFGGIDESGGNGSSGNPNLTPFTSNNIDLGTEYYFAEEGLIAVNLFYKSIDGLIVSTAEVEDREYLSQVSGQLVTGPITFSRPTNGDSTSVKGLEFIAQTRFDLIHESLADFGGIFNYTYADSDAAFELGSSNEGTAAIPGISKTSYNAIVYFDNGTFDARLSYAYRDSFVVTTSGSFGVPVFQNDRAQLDFSSSYRISDALSVQFQVLNITEERMETESLAGLPHDTAQLDRRFTLGVLYQM
tara:strand:- start:748 stop:3510 length:2763 start_codon:yes stop_codon:yes gene_type:complete